MPIIHGTAEPAEVAAAQAALGAERAGALVEDSLARAATLARGLGVTRFVVAGGETSGAITGALGVTALHVGAEIAPGVPWCAGEDGTGPLALALKSRISAMNGSLSAPCRPRASAAIQPRLAPWVRQAYIPRPRAGPAHGVDMVKDVAVVPRPGRGPPRSGTPANWIWPVIGAIEVSRRVRSPCMICK